MTDYDTFMVIGAAYSNQETAELDYEAVKSLYYDWDLIDNFDAAIVTKRDDGKVKILRKHEQPTRKGGWRGAGIGLATGAVIALFPAAAIGSGLLAATTGAGAAIGAIAGHVTKGMNRGDLKELGEQLDEGETGLIVVAAADVSAKVQQAIANAQDVIAKELEAAEAELEQDLKEAEDEQTTCRGRLRWPVRQAQQRSGTTSGSIGPPMRPIATNDGVPPLERRNSRSHRHAADPSGMMLRSVPRTDRTDDSRRPV